MTRTDFAPYPWLADDQAVYRGGVWYVSTNRYAELTSGDQERMEAALHAPAQVYEVSSSAGIGRMPYTPLDRLANGGGL